ncbi:MAG TPA: glycoside hydrolase family 76 protein [Candidatus Babeliaceae bacterium]|nr:glycoside hydrolase family 76 protein [Candidatus Babeliaceae bacterium]
MINKNSFLVVIIILPASFNLLSAQNSTDKSDGYYKEMKSLQTAIQHNLYDKASGNYRVVADSAKWEKKGNYRREFTYLWSLCALYQADNEIEKLGKDVHLMNPLLQVMNKYYNPAPPYPGYSDYIMKLKPGERYYDDNEWIGIAALNAYERTKDKSDLQLGKSIYNFMMSGYDTVLGGGLYWKETSKSSKNTCSNGPGVLVALQLYQLTNNKSYFDTGLMIYNWVNEKLKAPSGLYYDNIRTRDGGISKAILSYNTGTMLESNIYLYECTKDKKYLYLANTIADSSLSFFYKTGKFRDGYWFNAVLLRGYQHLLKYNHDTKYIVGFKRCLDNALRNDKDGQGLFRGRDGVLGLVDQGGMLEILARFAWLESHYDLPAFNASVR